MPITPQGTSILTHSNASFDSQNLPCHACHEHMGSQKHFLFLPPYFEGNIDVTDDILHHYALPNSIDNDTNFQVLQNDSYAYQLKYYSDEVVKYWKTVKKRDWRRRQKAVIRKMKELWVKLRKEPWYMHKFSKMDNGQIGICWWAETEIWKGMTI